MPTESETDNSDSEESVSDLDCKLKDEMGTDCLLDKNEDHSEDSNLMEKKIKVCNITK